MRFYVGRLCRRPGSRAAGRTYKPHNTSHWIFIGEKGKEFALKHCPNQQPTVYGDYNSLYNDPEVDVVYVGTPHTLHLQNTLDAIEAGKPVVCEKPFTINAKETAKLIAAAKANNVYLMEGKSRVFCPSSIADTMKKLSGLASSRSWPRSKGWYMQKRSSAKSQGCLLILDSICPSRRWLPLLG